MNTQSLEVVVEWEIGRGGGGNDEIEFTSHLLGEIFVGTGVDEVLYEDDAPVKKKEGNDMVR
jgi:hypothetical protein